ncbi:MAG: glycosyltransferase family 39 protein [Candidatus Coatesbacteria bacterium]|nr:MAG: glycosyltransferase family 39 protein [Candidatus Coatesbacteria bacterium]
MTEPNRKPPYRYLLLAAVATAAGAAWAWWAPRLGWAGGAAADPWPVPVDTLGALRIAVCFALPAVAWAVAAAAWWPRLALRLAGLLAHRGFVAALIVLAVAATAVLGAAVLGPAPRDYDEAGLLFQSKVFAGGGLAAFAPPTEGDLTEAFFRSRTEVVRGGRWFAVFGPLHPALLALGAWAGWAKLIPALAAGVVLAATYLLARRKWGYFAAAVAVVLVATSPLFLFTHASYYAEATFLAFFALALLAAEALGRNGRRREAVALGLAAGAAFLTSTYATLYLAVPLAWYLARRAKAGQPPGDRLWWFGAAALPFVAAWGLYNWRQTGNFFLPPALYAPGGYVGFDGGYGPAEALAATARNAVAVASDAFGWPLLCLLPAIIRLFLKPRLDDFEKALYGVFVVTAVASPFVRESGASFGARPYYGAALALAFITARFFGILGTSGPLRLRRAGEGVAALVLLASVAVNGAAYLPRAVAYYGRPRPEAAWAQPEVRRAVAAAGIADAVVIVRPREGCLTAVPGSPEFDEPVVFARDNGPRNRELRRLFRGRDIAELELGEAGPQAWKTNGSPPER